MSKRKNPVNVIQEFFETATAEQVSTMQAVILGIVHRRFDQAKVKKDRKPKPVTVADVAVVHTTKAS